MLWVVVGLGSVGGLGGLYLFSAVGLWVRGLRFVRYFVLEKVSVREVSLTNG